MKEYARTAQAIFLARGARRPGRLVFAWLRAGFVALYQAHQRRGGRRIRRQLRATCCPSRIIGTCYQAACLFGLVKSGGDICFVFKNDTIFVFLVVHAQRRMLGHAKRGRAGVGGVRLPEVRPDH